MPAYPCPFFAMTNSLQCPACMQYLGYTSSKTLIGATVTLAKASQADSGALWMVTYRLFWTEIVRPLQTDRSVILVYVHVYMERAKGHVDN